MKLTFMAIITVLLSQMAHAAQPACSERRAYIVATEFIKNKFGDESFVINNPYQPYTPSENIELGGNQDITFSLKNSGKESMGSFIIDKQCKIIQSSLVLATPISQDELNRIQTSQKCDAFQATKVANAGLTGTMSLYRERLRGTLLSSGFYKKYNNIMLNIGVPESTDGQGNYKVPFHAEYRAKNPADFKILKYIGIFQLNDKCKPDLYYTYKNVPWDSNELQLEVASKKIETQKIYEIFLSASNVTVINKSNLPISTHKAIVIRSEPKFFNCRFVPDPSKLIEEFSSIYENGDILCEGTVLEKNQSSSFRFLIDGQYQFKSEVIVFGVRAG